MDEVEFHAKLKHRHIVEYHYSWIEAQTFHDQSLINSWLKKEIGSSASDPKSGSCASDESLMSALSGESKYNPEVNNEKKEYLYIVMEHCSGGTLRNWLHGNKMRYSRKRTINLFCQICSGLAYIHNQGIIHRDLKPENIFLTKRRFIKIGDFGLAIAEDPTDLLTEEVGTREYMAPEIKNQQGYNHKADIFSLGLIFLELVVPCHTMAERQDVIKKILFRNSDEGLSALSLSLLRKMLDQNPVQRPEAVQVMQFFKETAPRLL
jgi:serine/threonine protein kinase